MPIAIAIALLASVTSAPPNTADIRYCGVASMQCMLKSSGIHLPAASIESRAKELNPLTSLSRMSLAELKAVLRSYGIDCKVGEIDRRNISTIPFPSILYFAPTSDDDVGHYVFLRQIAGEEAFIEDWTQAEPLISVPLSQLLLGWSGILLYAESARDQFFWLPWAGFIVSAGVLAFALATVCRICWSAWRNGGSSRSRAAATFAVLLANCFVGCNDRKVPLTCEKPLVEFPPMIEGADAQACFKIDAWSSGNVKVTAIKKSCECIASTNGDLAGKTISAGGSETLCLQVPTYGRAGLVQGSVVLLTDPPQDLPLTLVVRTYVESKPSLVSNAPLLLRAASPGAASQGTLRISVSRLPGSPQLKLDRARSSFADLEIVDESLHSSSVQPNGSQYQGNVSEVLDVQVQSSASNGEALEGATILGFVGRTDQLKVPYKIMPSNVLALELDSLYVHTISPGAKREFNIGLRCNLEPHELSRVAIKSNDHWISAAGSDNGDSVVLLVIAPEVRGRHEGSLELEYQSSLSDYKESLTFPVTVNVQN